MSDFFMVVGFALAAYAIVANDSIQTLGTFMASNAKRPWWVLWMWISGILVVTVTWGWLANGGDPAFGRLMSEKLVEQGKEVAFPREFTWLFVLPPLCLVVLTRMGIPVSTSLLVLTAFKGLVAVQLGEDAKGAGELFGSMMKKSLVGYAIAFVMGLVVVRLVTAVLEKRFFHESEEKRQNPHPGWMGFQWLSTGFLWAMWLVQDLANIFAYLPRELSWWGLGLSLLGMVLLQGYLFRERGGKIQGVVTSKTNTLDVRSATFIDLFYGLILLFFKVDYIPKLFAAMGMAVPWPEKMPMSTTWVFLGLLAGREIAVGMLLKHRGKQEVSGLVFRDAGKAFLGSAIAFVLAIFLPFLAVSLARGGGEDLAQEVVVEELAEEALAGEQVQEQVRRE
ncbi:MAG: hypothetical protein AAGC74_10560 [Verrucomicrobiota bacterium]